MWISFTFPQATGRGKLQDGKKRFEASSSHCQAWKPSTDFEALRRVYLYTSRRRWRQEYNTFRPHSSLNYRLPTPEAILTTWILHTIRGDPFSIPGGHGTTSNLTSGT